MEDLPIKAIVIGVSIFVTMTVFSAILIYFNTAKGIADSVSKRTDIAATYDKIMNSDNFEAVLSGVDVRSLITKYAGNESVNINIKRIGNETTGSYNNINNTWLIAPNTYSKLISEEKLDLINPIWNCRVEKVDNGDVTMLNISLNVKE